jgi:hypothetical protein
MSKKSIIIFTLKFTTSKLLAYIVVVSASILGYILKSAEIVIVGFTVGAALSGIKSMLESKNGNKVTNMSTENGVTDDESNSPNG